MAGINAFRAEFFSSDEANAATFESLPARLLRYDVGWAFYEGREWHSSFSQSLKVDEGLYKYITTLYNPTARVGDFYKGTIWRGGLDPEAGEKGAIPIKVGNKTDEVKLRAAIAHGWLVSAWDTNKSAHVLHGTTLGDAALYIRDDIGHGEARIEVLHPSLLKHVSFDNRGYVKAYVIEERRLDENKRVATYRETCEHGEGEDIVFRTYRDNSPFAWEGNVNKSGERVAQWTEKYGFVPLVLTQHINDGRTWGSSEIMKFYRKISAIDDQASILNDSIRRVIDPDYQANIKKGDSEITFTSGVATTDKPKPGREQRKIFWINNLQGRIEPIIVQINIADTSANIKQMLDSLEKDLPELRWYAISPAEQSNMSGKALRTLLGAAVDRATEARNNFLSSLSRAFEMALTIGIYNGVFPASLGTFDSGDFTHELHVDSAWGESVDEKAATMAALTGAGMPAKSAMKLAGFTDQQIADAFPAGVGETPNTPPAQATMKTGTIVTGTPPKAGTPVVRVG